MQFSKMKKKKIFEKVMQISDKAENLKGGPPNSKTKKNVTAQMVFR